MGKSLLKICVLNQRRRFRIGRNTFNEIDKIKEVLFQNIEICHYPLVGQTAFGDKLDHEVAYRLDTVADVMKDEQQADHQDECPNKPQDCAERSVNPSDAGETDETNYYRLD